MKKSIKMKYFYSIILLLLVSGVQSQSILIEKQLVDDLSSTPIYPKLISKDNGKTQWKEKFKYIDSIDIFIITYLSDGLKVKGLMVKPKKEGKYPCVIYNRGGNKDFASLKIAHGVFTLGRLAKQGYVVIASQYRGNAGGEGIEEFGGSDVNDVLNLIEVLSEVKSADTENIGMYGWSRGGMMTYIAATKTNKIKAIAVGGAISDCQANIEDRPEMEEYVYSKLIPLYDQNKNTELAKRSAINWADKFSKNVPILMLHGTSDWRVKPSQSLLLALEFDKYRVPYRLIMYEGADHGINEYKKEVNDAVVNWFDRYLKNNEKLPDMEFHGR